MTKPEVPDDTRDLVDGKPDPRQMTILERLPRTTRRKAKRRRKLKTAKRAAQKTSQKLDVAADRR